MQNKNGFKNLKKRYMAVLNKCKLLNVFGTLAVATMLAAPASAQETWILPFGHTIEALEISDQSVYLNGDIYGGAPGGIGWIGAYIGGNVPIFNFLHLGNIYVNPNIPGMDTAGVTFEVDGFDFSSLRSLGRINYGPNATGLKVDFFNASSASAIAIKQAVLNIGTKLLYGPDYVTFGGATNNFSVSPSTQLYVRLNKDAKNFGLNQAVPITTFFENAPTGLEDVQVLTETFLLKALYDKTSGELSVITDITAEKSPATVLSKANFRQFTAVLQNLSPRLAGFVIDSYVWPGARTLTDAGQEGFAAGSMADMSAWTLYASPYGSYSSDNEYDFDTDAFGITAGARYAFNDAFSLGFHFDYNNASTDSDVIDLDVDSNLYTFGVDMDYKFNNNWYVRGDLGFAIGQNNLDYTIGTVNADEDYSSTAFYAEAYAGYILELNKNNILIPELGLSYLYSSVEDVDVNFKGAGYLGEYDMNIDADAYSNLSAKFMLTWKGNYEFGNGHVIAPTVGLGISQSLTGDNIDSTLEFVGTRTTTEADFDGTSFVANAGVEWTKGAFSLGVYYNGVMGGEEQFHSGQAKLSYKF